MPSPRISLSYLVDFVLKNGESRLTVVKNCKYNVYNPAADYYKPLRDKLASMCRGEITLKDVRDWTSGVHSKKVSNYQKAVDGISRLTKHRVAQWLVPSKVQFAPTNSLLEVTVNPEMGFIDQSGERQLFKLYFKQPQEKLRKSKIGLILSLLDSSYPSAKNCGVLDVMTPKIHLLDPTKSQDLKILIEGETAAFAHLYNALPATRP